MDLDIINLTDEGYLMSPEYNNLSNFTVNNLEELSEIIRQAEAEETKHSAPAPIPSTADVVKRADPVQPSSQTAPEHAKDGTRPPVQTLHSSAPGRKRWRTPSSSASSSSSTSSNDSDGRPSVSRNACITAKTPRKCTHSFKCATCQRERQEIHLLVAKRPRKCTHSIKRATCQREKEENTSSRWYYAKGHERDPLCARPWCLSQKDPENVRIVSNVRPVRGRKKKIHLLVGTMLRAMSEILFVLGLGV
ncbi:uncharacterized protein LOC117258211 [Epinephelus lanceolatus]